MSPIELSWTAKKRDNGQKVHIFGVSSILQAVKQRNGDMQFIILQCMILQAEILCISRILQSVKQRNGNMGRKHLLRYQLSSYSFWSGLLCPLSSPIFSVILNHIIVSRQDVGTVKGVVWEEVERLLSIFLFKSKFVVNYDKMISHRIYVE